MMLLSSKSRLSSKEWSPFLLASDQIAYKNKYTIFMSTQTDNDNYDR